MALVLLTLFCVCISGCKQDTKAKKIAADTAWINAPKQFSPTLNDTAMFFFTKNCPSCKKMIGIINKIRNDGQVNVIGVYSPHQNAANIAKIKHAIKSQYKVNFPIAIDSDNKIMQQYAVIGWPTIIVINSHDEIIAKIQGIKSYNYIQSLLPTSRQRGSA